MKKILKPETTKPQYVVTTDITYAQVDSWFGHCRRDLKLDLIVFCGTALMGKKYGGAAGSAGTAADAVVLFPDGI